MCTPSCMIGGPKLCEDELYTPSCKISGLRFPYKLGQLSSSNNICSKANSFAVFWKKRSRTCIKRMALRFHSTNIACA